MLARSLRFASVLFTLLLLSHAASAYFVRPFITFGPGQTTDGLIVNGATSNTVQFNDAARSSRSTVDLATGEMSLFAQGGGPTVSSSGQGIMGETLNFQGGAGTMVDFDWGLEATLDATILGDTPNNSFLTWSITVAVFEADLVDHTNFFGNALQDDPTDIAPLFFQQVLGNRNNPAADINGFIIDESIQGSLELATNNETWDFFYIAGLSGIAQNELSSYVLDGENTATAGVQVEQFVEVGSGSGEFLGFPTFTTPEPSALAMLGFAVVALARGASRRR